MQQGEITDLEMTQTKAMLQNQLKEALDSARGQIEIYDQYKDLDEDFNVEAWQTKWQAISNRDHVLRHTSDLLAFFLQPSSCGI